MIRNLIDRLVESDLYPLICGVLAGFDIGLVIGLYARDFL